MNSATLPSTVGRVEVPSTSGGDQRGRGHWLSVIFWLVEQSWPTLLSIPTVIALVTSVGFALPPLAILFGLVKGS